MQRKPVLIAILSSGLFFTQCSSPTSPQLDIEIEERVMKEKKAGENKNDEALKSPIELPSFESWEEEKSWYAEFTDEAIISQIQMRCSEDNGEMFHYNVGGFFGEASRRLSESWNEELVKTMLTCLSFPISADDAMTFVANLHYIEGFHSDKFTALLKNQLKESEVKAYYETVENLDTGGNN
ncbi:MAG: hypothetical protein JJU02_09550 [Cryomorphaceae bacterium]|nr:hypothetical protein [Cryomorphaceae bacterium]